MSDEAKQFIFGLEQCRSKKGMIWHGKFPKEIVELFDVDVSESKLGQWIAGVYVSKAPQYKAFTPEWLEKGRDKTVPHSEGGLETLFGSDD